MSSFNGSGYADKSSASNYLESYVAFKRLKKKHDAVDIVLENPVEALVIAEHLLDAAEPGHRPSEKNYKKFMDFYKSGGGRI